MRIPRFQTVATLLALTLAFAAPRLAIAQDAAVLPAAPAEPAAIEPAAGSPASMGAGGFVIGELRFEIRGRTRELFLRKAAEIEEGRRFPDQASLDAYLADRTQLLVNKRTIEKAAIEPVFGEAGADGAVVVDLILRVEDTVNIIALPYFKYDSNDGLLLSARGRDYNFLGTMQPLKLDLNYTVDTNGDQEWEVTSELELPFRMGGLDYSWSFDQSAAYTADEVLNYEATTSVDLSLPLWGGVLTVGPSQGLSVNPDNDDDTLFEGWYLKSVASGSYSIPLPVDLRYFGRLYGGLYAWITHYWNPTGLELNADRAGPILGFSQSLSFGRVDWIGNLRRGLAARASLSESYNLETAAWDRSFSAYVLGHYRFGPRLGGSGRARAVYYLDGAEADIGDDVRGILDSRIDTDAALFVNLEMPVRVYYYMPHEWTGVDWLRFIALEQYWSPFLDLALTHDQETGRWLDPRDGWYGAGMEVITYPYKFRSFYVRISAGWDVPTLLKTKSLSGRSERDGRMGREIYIGLGHHF